MKKNDIWFVTGASKGLGHSIVAKLLSQGYKVAATSRSLDALIKAFGEESNQFLPLSMNLSSEEDVKRCLKEAHEHFGRLDIIVNNAGYAQYGYVEEVTDAETRSDFEVNVFGLLKVIRNALPYLRKENSGHIINISSKGGFHAGAGTGIYCASKYAVEGLSEALYFEMKDFNIHVTAVKPGGFRTDFFGSLKQTENRIDVYETYHQATEKAQAAYIGHQLGNPERAAEVLIEISKSEEPPLHLFLGSDAYHSAGKKFREVTHDMETWHDLAVSTDYPDERG